MDKVGFYSMEVWGGATFDATHRYLNEDPWERLRLLKEQLVNTPLSMLLRGQNLVGYRNYPDDIVEAFIQRASDNGIDIFRVFDALNDFRNFQTAVKVIKKNDKHFQGSICYSLTEPRMGGDVYTLDYYLEKAKALEEMGADSICIKDMAGLIAPYDAYNLVSALKSTVKVPIHLHTHFTSGMADLTMLKAIEAGVDIIDTCVAPYAYRTSHPATIIDSNVILHQTPGGMLSNLVNQLKQMGELDKLEDVFKALPGVRKDLGQAPLVTPTSQIVGTQTVNNVLFDKEGEEYSRITQQVKDLCYGLYGQAPRPLRPEIQKKALKGYSRGEQPITVRPGEILEGELESAKKEIGDLAKDLDDLLIYALFPVTGKRFLTWKYGLEEVPQDVIAKTLEEIKREKELVEKALAGELVERSDKQAPEKPENLRSFDVFVDGEYFKVELGGDGVRSTVPAFSSQVQRVAAPPKAPKQVSKTPASVTPVLIEGEHAVTAPLPGMIISYEKSEGDEVKAGEAVVILEAMKMHNTIEAPTQGVVRKISFKEGDNVPKGGILFVIEDK
jgi:pyruvate/oxaloacetate carboxyltransferase/biotin carboxyl carrier protein